MQILFQVGQENIMRHITRFWFIVNQFSYQNSQQATMC